MSQISAAYTETQGMVHEVNEITLDHPWRWIAAGWNDYKSAPVVSLAYGSVFVLASYLITLLVFSSDLFFLVPPLAAGFFLVAPVLAVGLYDNSRRLEQGDWCSFSRAITAWRRNPFNLAVMGLLLMMSMLFWMMLANLVFAIFFSGVVLTLDNFTATLFLSGSSPAFLVAGVLAGGLIAASVFTITVISVPMLIDKEVGVHEAVLTSFKAVLKNPVPLWLWACLIVMFVCCGLVTFYLGFFIFMPLVAYASWHAYRDLVVHDDGKPEASDI